MNNTVILLCGHAGAGKSTFANVLASIARDNLVPAGVHSTGDPVKEIAEAIGLQGTKHELRRVYQIGAQYVRHVDPAYWARHLSQRLRDAHAGGEVLSIVDDFRFPNEYAYLTDPMIPTHWRRRVIVGRILGRKYDLPHEEAEDVSEHAWREVRPNFIVHNDWTLTALERLAELAWNDLTKRLIAPDIHGWHLERSML